jgi:hypothetical protein
MSDFKKFLNAYEFEAVLPGSGETITFNPITIGQIKKVLTYENEDDPRIIEKVLDDIITSSVTSKDFNIDDLTLQDRFFILVEIRKKSKGNIYKFKWECENCKTQNLASIDLNKMKVISVPEDIDYVVKLNDNISLRLKYVTRKDIKEGYRFFDESLTTPSQKFAELASIIHAASIASIITPEGEDNNISWEDKLYIVNETPQLFYEKISEWTNKYNYGIDFSYELRCTGCGKVMKREVPLEDFFF